MEERKLTDKEERIAQSLPDKEFKKRYGKDWKSVKIATATKMAKMKESVIRKYIKEQIKSLHEERRVVKIYQSWKKGEKANLNDLGEGNYGFDPRAIAQYFKPLNSRVGIAKEDVSVFGMSNGSVELHASSDKDKFHEQEDEPSDAEYDQMAKDAEQDDLMRKAAELGYLDLEENELDELNSYEMGKLPDFELLRKNVSQMLGVEVDDDVRSGMYNGREGYYSRISRRDLTDWSKEQIEKLKQAFKKTNFESNDYEFEYNSVSDFEVEPGERDYPASFDYFATEKKYGDDDRDNFPDLEESDKDDYGRSVSGKDKRTFVDPKDLTPAARAKKLAGLKEMSAELGYLEEEENLKEITISGGQEAARNYPPTENPGDMFAQKEVEELLPSSFESRNQELKARIQAHAEWAKQDRFNNTFVHFQANTVTDGNNIYRIGMSQHYNGNYTDFKNPRFTEIKVKELDDESDMERDLGYYIVDTTALMQDLRKLKTIERVS